MKKKFIDLLSQNKFFINESIKTENLDIENIGLMPKDVVYQIYSRRIKTSKKIDKYLIDRIKTFPENKILLTRLLFGKREFIIMTDENVQNLIGVISTIG